MTIRYFAITGGPGSGKTTLLSALEGLGYSCGPESGRAIIRRRLAEGLAPRPDAVAFAREMLRLDIDTYESMGADDLAFFDRCVVDCLSYLDELGAMGASEIDAQRRKYPFHPVAFIAPPWREIYCNDEERDQSFEEGVAIYQTLHDWYAKAGHELVELPKVGVGERVEFVLDRARLASRNS